MNLRPLAQTIIIVVIFLIVALSISLVRNELIIQLLPEEIQSSARIGASLSSSMTIVISLFLICILHLVTWYFLIVHSIKIKPNDYISCVSVFFIILVINEILKGGVILFVFKDEIKYLPSTIFQENLLNTDYYKITTFLDMLFVFLAIFSMAERLYNEYHYPLKTSLISFFYLSLGTIITIVIFKFD
jgi:hypothetical protein